MPGRHIWLVFIAVLLIASCIYIPRYSVSAWLSGSVVVASTPNPVSTAMGIVVTNELYVRHDWGKVSELYGTFSGHGTS